MSPAAFVDAVSAWALAPGFTRARDGQRPSAASFRHESAGDAEQRHRSSDLGAGRTDARGPGGAGATGAHPSDHRPCSGLPCARRHVTDESEAA